ncbi:cell envelope biogenesis protein TonB [Shewanella sp. NFH-SH190041]|uniref:energy transducer TonB n=1 Tax=Shewanella sp. NFH-SH190041 TaxID=2950245 RepID=UPI0021C33E7A|nr:energy transducer TonB [Shewanella sp. NFH-SH190041]BDM65249.1 cell envelope biogenesis protein TonB [Shewanella sp. NFH-SH190041]
MHTRIIAATLLGSVLVLPSQAATDFTQTYRDYQASLSQGDKAHSLTLAAQAYHLGQQQFGHQHINTTNLAMNYAKALLEQSHPGDEQAKQGITLYQQALERYQTEYGQSAKQLLDPLTQLALHHDDPRRVKTYISKMLAIAKGLDDPLLLASVYDVGAQALAGHSHKASRYAHQAYQLYLQHTPENALERNLAAFRLAKFKLANKDYRQAAELLESVTHQFDVLDYSHPVALSARAYLVRAYEHQGLRQQASKHCQAIGQMTPWQDDVEQTPIYRITPEYPASALRAGKEGWVELEFVIDPQGFVTQPVVLNSSGGSSFERSTLTMMEKWRYAPKFEQGKPVAAKSRIRIDFKRS